MARKTDSKTWVYPSARVFRLLGNTSPKLNRALEVWAGEIRCATRKNAEAFTPAEWNFIADLMSTGGADEHWLPTTLQRVIEDGYSAYSEAERADIPVDEHILIKKIGKLRPAEFWALIGAVEHFWANHKQIGCMDGWWLLGLDEQGAHL